MAQYPSMVTIACTPNLMPIQHIYIGHSSLSRHFYSIIYGFAICLLICSHILTFMCNIRRRFDISKNVVRNEELKKILDLSTFSIVLSVLIVYYLKESLFEIVILLPILKYALSIQTVVYQEY